MVEIVDFSNLIGDLLFCNKILYRDKNVLFCYPSNIILDFVFWTLVGNPKIVWIF